MKHISWLNIKAFGLAVYASQYGLLRPTQHSLPVVGQPLPGRLILQGFYKGFDGLTLCHSSSFLQASWRNHIVFMIGR
jgi:hypothetical protein